LAEALRVYLDVDIDQNALGTPKSLKTIHYEAVQLEEGKPGINVDEVVKNAVAVRNGHHSTLPERIRELATDVATQSRGA
jgi:hypothetical protein